MRFYNFTLVYETFIRQFILQNHMIVCETYEIIPDIYAVQSKLVLNISLFHIIRHPIKLI